METQRPANKASSEYMQTQAHGGKTLFVFSIILEMKKVQRGETCPALLALLKEIRSLIQEAREELKYPATSC